MVTRSDKQRQVSGPEPSEGTCGWAWRPGRAHWEGWEGVGDSNRLDHFSRHSPPSGKKRKTTSCSRCTQSLLPGPSRPPGGSHPHRGPLGPARRYQTHPGGLTCDVHSMKECPTKPRRAPLSSPLSQVRPRGTERVSSLSKVTQHSGSVLQRTPGAWALNHRRTQGPTHKGKVDSQATQPPAATVRD